MSGDQQDRQASAEIVTALESVLARMQTKFGFTDDQVGLALLACGLNSLSRVWTGEQIVAHLSQILVTMAEFHGINPETGKAGAPPIRN